MANTYSMTISRQTVDKLGVRLYDRVSAVIAELVSNSYDADATKVTVTAPLGVYLASKAGGGVKDLGYRISVKDDGVGMTPQEMQDFYLVIGRERRTSQGDFSRRFNRAVMGRKGVGKLAPFGICAQIEVISSGGEPITRILADGSEETGYLTSHIILNYHDIVSETDAPYPPEIGSLDDTLRPTSGTETILSNFVYRKVPTGDELLAQLAQRFGLTTAQWSVEICDTNKPESAPDRCLEVGTFAVQLMADTKVEFQAPAPTLKLPAKTSAHRTIGEQGIELAAPLPGFTLDGMFYPVRGWVAYAKSPYKDDLMAGVRVYCRGKIAAQTAVFNLKAGFTGEHSIRSYLVGELHCDWLDQDDDLIQTDRRDILWSHELGQAFEEWGQAVVKAVGNISRNPMRTRVLDLFLATADLDNRINAQFPSSEDRHIRERAREIASMFGKKMREDEAQDAAVVNDIVDLSILIAPYIELDDKLREAADQVGSPIAVVSGILRTARLAELHSFGRIAYDRVRVIDKVAELKDTKDTPEEDLQALIEEAPWLIEPQWAPITSNQTLNNVKKAFATFYKDRTGEDINLTDFSEGSKRPDFVMIAPGTRLEIIEIKRPKHKLANDEYARIDTYKQVLDQFFDEPAHQKIRAAYPDRYHITLVCDALNLSGPSLTAFKGLQTTGVLDHVNWEDFLFKTRQAHKEFLELAEKQKKIGN